MRNNLLALILMSCISTSYADGFYDVKLAYGTEGISYVGAAGMGAGPLSFTGVYTQDFDGKSKISLAQLSLSSGPGRIDIGRIGVPFGLHASAEGSYVTSPDQPVGSPIFRAIRSTLASSSDGVGVGYEDNSFAISLAAYRPEDKTSVSQIFVTEEIIGGVVAVPELGLPLPIEQRRISGIISSIVEELLPKLPLGSSISSLLPKLSQSKIDRKRNTAYHLGLVFPGSAGDIGLDALRINGHDSHLTVLTPYSRTSFSENFGLETEALYIIENGNYGLSLTPTYTIGQFLIFATASEFPETNDADRSLGAIYSKNNYSLRASLENTQGILKENKMNFAVGIEFQ